MSIKALIPEIRALVQDGFFIFPVHITKDDDGKPTKKPAVKGYTSLKIEDPDEAVELFKKVDANAIGMVLALNGLVVVDVDSYKPECNFYDHYGVGPTTKADLNTLTAETGQGGRHYYYEAEAGVRYKGKIDGIEAVDIKHRGFVVMPPSDGYKWINEVAILPAPDWIPRREVTKPQASNPLVNIGRGTSDTLIKMVEEAANTMDDRDDWLNVGLGLHHEYHGTALEERAMEAYLNWSVRWDVDADAEGRQELISEAAKVWEHADSKTGTITGATTNFLIKNMGHVKISVPDDEPTLNWLNETLPPPDWLIEGFLEKEEIMGLAGASNAGKTRWLCMLVAALSAGRPDLVGITDGPRDPVKVMMVSNEENTNALKRRVRAAYILNKLKLTQPIIWAGQGWLEGRPHTTLLTTDPKSRRTVVNEQVVEAIIDRALDTEADLITFDPYITLGINNENDQTDNNEMFGVFRRIAEETGAAILFIHHTGKGEKRTESPDTVRGLMSAFRGSSVITSSMDSGFSLLPYLAGEIAAKPAQRAALAEGIKAGTIPNYVALDWVKRREAKMGAARYYIIQGVHLPDGYEIAAMKPVTEEVAKLTQVDALSGGEVLTGAVKRAAGKIDVLQMANVLAEGFDHNERFSIRSLHAAFHDVVAGWPDSKSVKSTHGAVVYALKELTGSLIETPHGKIKLRHVEKTEHDKGGYQLVKREL